MTVTVCIQNRWIVCVYFYFNYIYAVSGALRQYSTKLNTWFNNNNNKMPIEMNREMANMRNGMDPKEH